MGEIVKEPRDALCIDQPPNEVQWEECSPPLASLRGGVTASSFGAFLGVVLGLRLVGRKEHFTRV